MTDTIREALQNARDWFDQQRDAISKGAGSTWDLLQVREQRDLCDAALAAQPRQVSEESVAWRIQWSPIYSDQFELTSDPARIAGILNLEDPPIVEPLYAAPQPASAPVGAKAQVGGDRKPDGHH